MPMIVRLSVLLLAGSLVACVGANSTVRSERGASVVAGADSTGDEESGAALTPPGERVEVAAAPDSTIAIPDDEEGGAVDDPTSEPTPLPIDEPGRPVQMR